MHSDHHDCWVIIESAHLTLVRAVHCQECLYFMQSFLLCRGRTETLRLLQYMPNKWLTLSTFLGSSNKRSHRSILIYWGLFHQDLPLQWKSSRTQRHQIQIHTAPIRSQDPFSFWNSAIHYKLELRTTWLHIKDIFITLNPFMSPKPPAYNT